MEGVDCWKCIRKEYRGIPRRVGVEMCNSFKLNQRNPTAVLDPDIFSPEIAPGGETAVLWFLRTISILIKMETVEN